MRGQLSAVLPEFTSSLFTAVSPCISSVVSALLVSSRSVSEGLFATEARYCTVALLSPVVRIP